MRSSKPPRHFSLISGQRLFPMIAVSSIGCVRSRLQSSINVVIPEVVFRLTIKHHILKRLKTIYALFCVWSYRFLIKAQCQRHKRRFVGVDGHYYILRKWDWFLQDSGKISWSAYQLLIVFTKWQGVTCFVKLSPAPSDEIAVQSRFRDLLRKKGVTTVICDELSCIESIETKWMYLSMWVRQRRSAFERWSLLCIVGTRNQPWLMLWCLWKQPGHNWSSCWQKTGNCSVNSRTWQQSYSSSFELTWFYIQSKTISLQARVLFKPVIAENGWANFF